MLVPPRRGSSHGFALVVVLCLVVLVSAILITFLSVMQLDRSATQSYSGGMSAEQIAQGAFLNIEGQLMSEIADGSTRYGRDGTASNTTAPYVYWPKAAANMLVQEAGMTAVGPLVKVSSRTAPLYANGSVQASAASSATAAGNGRLIPLTRWNKPQLLSAWPAAAAAPDWICVTRNGPQVVTAAQAADASLSNSKFVIGRYAYTIYDTGGLLDVTAAGYPATGTDLTAAVIAQKGFLSLADLTQIPNGTSAKLTTSQVNALVKWRNKASVASSYLTFLNSFVSPYGGLKVYDGDNTFINRQDLISYATINSITGALPYLTTFHRSLNAPSYSPDADVVAAPSKYAYKTNAFPTAVNVYPTGSINRCIPNVRVLAASLPWSRQNDDGTTTPAVVGEPLVKQRFPLSRIALLTISNPTSDQQTKISKYFGLTTGATIHDAWTYNALDASGAICTLEKVAAAGREANFFELLKAAILNGSLGRSPGAVMPTPNNGSALGVYSDVDALSVSTDLQIMRIGVNIIDQYGANNYPTTINTQLYAGGAATLANFVYGIKNLPYYVASSIYALDPTPPMWDGTASKMSMWMQPVLWNPHQTTTASLPGPVSLRIQAFGSANFSVSYFIKKTGVPFVPPPVFPTNVTTTQNFSAQTGGSYWNATTPDADSSHPNANIQFSASTDFSTNPVPLTLSNVDTTGTGPQNLPSTLNPANWPSTSPQIAGFGFPQVTWFPDQATMWYPTNNKGGANVPLGLAALAMNYALQWLDPATGTWRTYQVVNKLENQGVQVSPNRIDPSTQAFYKISADGTIVNAPGDSLEIVEPRTDRFGISIPNAYVHTATARPTGAVGAQFLGGVPRTTSGFVMVGETSGVPYSHPGFLEENTTSMTTGSYNMYYSDLDGTVRGADGIYGTVSPSSAPNGFPLVTAPNNGSQRPLMLARPFRSVGELGYAFRDLPFKSLDFFTSLSADEGLLDVFCVDTASTNAGKVNLNSAPAPVISAIISGGMTKETATTTLSTADAGTVGTLFTSQVARSNTPPTPLIHRGNIVNALGTAAMTTALANSADKYNKTQRESAVRSLAEVSDQRTWNLLIDVITQAGRYPPQGTNLDTNFQPSGEKRYWLHVAIDRVTGQIIASQLEPVYE